MLSLSLMNVNQTCLVKRSPDASTIKCGAEGPCVLSRVKSIIVGDDSQPKTCHSSLTLSECQVHL